MTASEADAPPPLPLDDIAMAATGDQGAPAPMALDEVGASQAGPPPEALDLLADSGQAGPAPAPSEGMGPAASAIHEDPPGPTEGPGGVDAGQAVLDKLQGTGDDQPPAPMPLEDLEDLESA